MVNLLSASSEFSQYDAGRNWPRFGHFYKAFYSSSYFKFSVKEKQRNQGWVYIWGNI